MCAGAGVSRAPRSGTASVSWEIPSRPIPRSQDPEGAASGRDCRVPAPAWHEGLVQSSDRGAYMFER